MVKPSQQPIEGEHPSKEDVPGPPSTSAIAGEGKGEPDDDRSDDLEQTDAGERG